MNFDFRSGESDRPTKKQMNTLEAEIKKLETDIENMKQDMNTSVTQPESVAAPDLSIQAPLPPANTAIGDVIAELKAHNVAKTIQRAQKHKSGIIVCHPIRSKMRNSK